MKPFASISLDLDNKWSYMKTHGDSGWDEYPTYLDVLLPKVLDMFQAQRLSLTFFVVGQDAALDKNREALSMISAHQHEVGNHSFRHEPWLHRYTDQEVADELSGAQDAIERATGIRPTGFRGPGFSCSTVVLRELHRQGFRFDASTFPTYLGPLARAYYFMTSGLSKGERAKRDQLFGSMADGLRPLQPYLWDLGQADLLEIPVTTMPLTKTPFHLSYIIYLSTFSTALASLYFSSALSACRMAGIEPSLLLHPLDFLGSDDVRGLDFFPGMNLPGSVKRERVAGYVSALTSRFQVVPMGRHAEEIRKRGRLKKRSPDFAS
jgi:peptidoglycan-N-acetylglucosamine deacetylase